MNTAFIQKYLVYSGKSCTYSLRFGGASQQVFPAPQFPPQMVLALSSNGNRFDNSSRLLRMVFPTSGTKNKYINTMLSHDFNSKFQTISRVIYLPYHPFYANQSSNQKINALKPPTKPTTACAKCQEMFFFQLLQPREYRNCSHGTQQRQGPSRTSLKGKRSFQDFLDTSPTKERKDRKKRRDNHAKTGTKEEGKNRKEGKERKNRKENERKEGNYRKGSKGRMNKRQGKNERKTCKLLLRTQRSCSSSPDEFNRN